MIYCVYVYSYTTRDPVSSNWALTFAEGVGNSLDLGFRVRRLVHRAQSHPVST